MTIRSCVRYLLVVTVRPFHLCFNMSVFKALAGAVNYKSRCILYNDNKSFLIFEFEFGCITTVRH